jgi:hypothetical protein
MFGRSALTAFPHRHPKEKAKRIVRMMFMTVVSPVVSETS